MSDTLARTIWGEARGEGGNGMRAVACVIMNRVEAGGWFGHDIESVCKKKWQFSCWNSNDPNLQKLLSVMPSDPMFAAALGIQDEAVSGNLKDITNGATHYFVKNMPNPPKWAEGKEPCAEIGHHVFYRIV